MNQALNRIKSAMISELNAELYAKLFPPREPKVWTVRWHDEDNGWNTVQIVAFSRVEAQTLANQISGGNFVWVFAH